MLGGPRCVGGPPTIPVLSGFRVQPFPVAMFGRGTAPGVWDLDGPRGGGG